MQSTEVVGPANTMAMDVVAKDGTILRLTVHRTDEGHVELDSLVEVAEHYSGGLRPLVAYRLRSMLVDGDLTLHDQVPGLVIEQPWLITFGNWAWLAAETLTDMHSRSAGVNPVA